MRRMVGKQRRNLPGKMTTTKTPRPRKWCGGGSEKHHEFNQLGEEENEGPIATSKTASK